MELEKMRRGFTLVEMLVSLAITLIMMGAVVTIFGLMGNSVSNSRAIIETAERLRSAQNRLQLDLEGTTATMQPPLRPEEDQGYFEVVEGPATDSNPLGPTPPNPLPKGYTLLGDSDDVLMMTVRSKGEPFVGVYVNSSGQQIPVQSQVAEIIWFTRASTSGPILDPDANDPANGNVPPLRTRNLYRRVLLVAPSLTQNSLTGDAFFEKCDVSARWRFPQPNPATMAFNTLGDLTKRENRFGHNPFYDDPDDPMTPSFPFPKQAFTGYPRPNLIALSSSRLGEDVILSNVLSFDVKLYDPGAPVIDVNGKAIVPGDPGYPSPVSGTPISLGAYVDPGYLYTPPDGVSVEPSFSVSTVPAKTKRHLVANTPQNIDLGNVYDTWSLHYEQNGISEDGDSATDEGRDGLDSDSPPNGVVDDPGEAETSAPYPSQLRGIQVKIRLYEPDSQAVRQVTVVQDFLPE